MIEFPKIFLDADFQNLKWVEKRKFLSETNEDFRKLSNDEQARFIHKVTYMDIKNKDNSFLDHLKKRFNRGGV